MRKAGLVRCNVDDGAVKLFDFDGQLVNLDVEFLYLLLVARLEKAENQNIKSQQIEGTKAAKFTLSLLEFSICANRSKTSCCSLAFSFSALRNVSDHFICNSFDYFKANNNEHIKAKISRFLRSR